MDEIGPIIIKMAEHHRAKLPKKKNTPIRGTPTNIDQWRENVMRDLAFDCDRCHDRGGFDQIGTLYGELSWREFCDCELGQQQAANHAIQQKLYDRQQAERRISSIFSWADEPELYADWTLATYPAIGDKAALLTCQRFVNQPDADKHSLLFLGPSGRGKTGLTIGIIRQLTEQGKVCLFVQTAIYLEKLRDAFARGSSKREEDREAIGASAEQIRETCRTVDVLALDDFGDPDRKGDVSDWAREELFSLINYRYAHKLPTLITTNCTEGQIHSQYGARTLQRIKHMSQTLILKGANLREQH